MRVLVCGGRNYANKKCVYEELDRLHAVQNIAFLMQGGATGADALARSWAMSRQVPQMEYPAAWKDLSHPDARVKTRADGSRYDANAGHRRNQVMLDEKPDRVVAFPGGFGTRDMCQLAAAAKIPIDHIIDSSD
ncbi:MAG: SLOG family protein [Candidatus Sulfotelmatobacter sp.]